MEDLRKCKSKRQLKTAFLELFYEKPYRQITITDICTAAELNRKTFYTNYETVDNLLRDCIADRLSVLFNRFKDCDPRASYNFFLSMQIYIDMILENKDFFQRIIQNNLDHQVGQVWQSLYIEFYPTSPAKDLDSSAKQELFYTYGMNICWGNLLWAIHHSDQPADVLLATSLECHQHYVDFYHDIYHPKNEQ